MSLDLLANLIHNGKEFDMLPKKIYLNYIEEDDEDKTWSEQPVSVVGCEMQNREYTDLSQVWRDTCKTPNSENTIVCLTRNEKVVSLYSVDRYRWDWYVEKYAIIKWAYVVDLLPKGSKV